MPTGMSDDVARLSTLFWENLKNGNLEVAHTEGARLRDIVPPLEAFSFELIEGDNEGKETPFTSVQLGTLKPTIDEWNSDEPV
jgi:hypothetical protein